MRIHDWRMVEASSEILLETSMHEVLPLSLLVIDWQQAGW